MSDDFIQEIKEDVRAEQLLNFFKTYANHLISALIALIVITAGYLYWTSHKASQINATAQHFEKALTHIEKNEAAQVQKILNDMTSHTPGGEILKLLSLAQTGNKQALKTLSADSSIPFVYRQLSDYLILLTSFDDNNFKFILEEVQKSLGKDNPWKPLLLELKGLALLKGKEKQAALKVCDELVQDEKTPQALKLRSIAYLETYSKN